MTGTATRAAALLGERLRMLREKNEVSQVTLAGRSGVRQSHISSIETGAMLPTLATLFRIAAALPCKMSELISVFDEEDLTKLLPK